MRTGELRVDGDEPLAKVKGVVHQGNVRRITPNDREANTIIIKLQLAPRAQPRQQHREEAALGHLAQAALHALRTWLGASNPDLVGTRHLSHRRPDHLAHLGSLKERSFV